MAIFGRDFYGLTKYGANVFTEFDVNPFDANPEGYGAIRVTWRSPAGEWTGLRLLRSRTGYAVDETDGQVLIDSANPAQDYLDLGDNSQGLVGGSWYYYTIFIQNARGWNRAGATSALCVKKPWVHPRNTFYLTPPSNIAGIPQGDAYVDQRPEPYGHADLLWDRIPRYFRWIRPDDKAITDSYFVAPNNSAVAFHPDLYDQENQHLRQFVGVLGWGLDFVHNYAETLMWANDPKRAHLSDVDRLAQELGIEFEYGVPAPVMRSKVLNAALLARRRGTLDGLRDVASLSTGWDIDIEVNQNLFLNRDQSEFANPIFPEWDSGVNYATGQKAQFEGRIVTALQGAYGMTERPPYTSEGVSNTYWQVTTDEDVTTLHNPTTGAVVTWKGFVDGSTPQTLSLAIGISDPFSGTDQESNALAVRNTDTAAHDYDVVGASNLSSETTLLPEQNYAIRQAIPVPHFLSWDPEFEYGLGQFVTHGGASWKSTGTSLGEAPRVGSLFWQKVGIDTRPLMAYSFYAHGNDATGGVAVTPGLAYFDDKGSLIQDQVDVVVTSSLFFDTFNNEPGTNWVLRDPDVTFSGQKWLLPDGEWAIEDLDGDSISYATSTVSATVVPVPASLTSYRVAVTFAKANAKQSLIFRYLDTDNYLRVTTTKVQKRQAGTVTDLWTLATPLVDGDRVTLALDDTANTWILFVNDTQVASGSSTLAGATAPYSHGMMVTDV